MSSINKVILTGRLTKDVEVRKTQSGHSVAQFNIAVDRNTKEGGTDFIRCTAWRHDADFLANYGDKGRMIAISGHIRTGQYEKDGQTHYTFDIDCEQVAMMDSRKQEPTPAPDAPQEPEKPASVGKDDLPF